MTTLNAVPWTVHEMLGNRRSDVDGKDAVRVAWEKSCLTPSA